MPHVEIFYYRSIARGVWVRAVLRANDSISPSVDPDILSVTSAFAPTWARADLYAESLDEAAKRALMRPLTPSLKYDVFGAMRKLREQEEFKYAESEKLMEVIDRSYELMRAWYNDEWLYTSLSLHMLSREVVDIVSKSPVVNKNEYVERVVRQPANLVYKPHHSGKLVNMPDGSTRMFRYHLKGKFDIENDLLIGKEIDDWLRVIDTQPKLWDNIHT